MKDLKTEQYKGYPIKFVEKIVGGKKVVVGEFPSKITKQLLGEAGTTKELVLDKCKKLINKEYKLYKR